MLIVVIVMGLNRTVLTVEKHCRAVVCLKIRRAVIAVIVIVAVVAIHPAATTVEKWCVAAAIFSKVVSGNAISRSMTSYYGVIDTSNFLTNWSKKCQKNKIKV
jgi:hypothetical protein